MLTARKMSPARQQIAQQHAADKSRQREHAGDSNAAKNAPSSGNANLQSDGCGNLNASNGRYSACAHAQFVRPSRATA